MNGETLEVHDKDGKVVFTFPVGNTSHWLSLEPHVAAAFAEHVARAAHKAHTGREPMGQGPRLKDQVIERLIMTAAHMITSLLRQDKQPGLIANEVVAMVLREVA